MLSRLLQATQPVFDTTIKQLEEQTGNRSTDAQLIAEILETAHQKMRELQLDPADTNGKELYATLLNTVKKHDEHLAKELGGQDPTSLREMTPKILQRIEDVDMPRGGWFLKDEVAKDMLLHMPPKNVIGRLGYSSAKKMLQNENLYEVYGALRFAEESDWLEEYNRQYTSLTPDDFQTRKIRIIQYDPDKWGDIAAHFIQKKLHNITHLKELGVIMTMPVSSVTPMPGVTLKVMPLILHYFNEIRLYSSFFKLMKDKKNFGEIFTNTLIADPSPVAVTQTDTVHWRVLQRYFGKLKDEHHPEMFEPHVQPEDLHWRKAEEVLYEVDPELEFWRDLDFIGLFVNDEEPVTFNLMDVGLSYSNQLSFQDRYLYHFREALWNEIFVRYLGQQNLEDRVLKRLDNDLIAPETIKQFQ
ncbi:hypothetical protein BRC19_02190 [Candidatus Saccharibacteria bacterium QS_5_54_17]|nr:MAG: hypothetical protein BRC19_02190 [Candidatus Saccharibacteria bacterium QS_5_54_17]